MFGDATASPLPACGPGGAAGPVRMERIKGYIAELRGLEPKDLTSVVVPLEALLPGTGLTTTSPGTDTYKAPGDADLVIFQIHGEIRWSSVASLNAEPTSILGWLNLPPSERYIVKAQNCIVRLEDADRNIKYFDNHDINLSALMPPVGYPLVFPPEAPLLVPRSEILKATFTLQDSTTAIVGGQTVYGLICTGVLVPRVGSRP